MAEPTYAFIIWEGSEQKSVIKCSTITKGIPVAEQKVTAKWRARSYAATVIETGNYLIICTVQLNSVTAHQYYIFVVFV